jgi:hypothetical protein
MPRKQASPEPAATGDQAARGKGPHVIDPHAVYDVPTAAHCLGLAKNCLPREIRLGRLRVAKRAGRYLVTGLWLLEWIQRGEVTRHRGKAAAENCGTTDG